MTSLQDVANAIQQLPEAKHWEVETFVMQAPGPVPTQVFLSPVERSHGVYLVRADNLTVVGDWDNKVVMDGQDEVEAARQLLLSVIPASVSWQFITPYHLSATLSPGQIAIAYANFGDLVFHLNVVAP